MEIIKTEFGKAIIMSFVTAEHSGMSYDDLSFESEISGIDLKKENPIALIIQFDGGFINPTEKDIEATDRFEKLVAKLNEVTNGLPPTDKSVGIRPTTL